MLEFILLLCFHLYFFLIMYKRIVSNKCYVIVSNECYGIITYKIYTSVLSYCSELYQLLMFIDN